LKVKSLFLRVFLWFWLAMAAVVGLLVVLSPSWTRVRPAFAHWEQRAFARLSHEAETAEELLKAAGPDGVQAVFRWLGIPPNATIYLIDSRGDDVFGEVVPENVAELAEAALAGGTSELRRDGRRFMIARPVSDGDDVPFVVAIVRGPPGPPPRPIEILEPLALLPLIGVIVLVVGGLSYWLARYLSRPVAALRTATRRLTGGDLTARVGSSVGRRPDEIGDLARDFDVMAERVETLIGSQRRLLRDVSHELRSPLARLEVALELARQRAGEAAGPPLDRIEREAGRLEEMIEQLLTLERMETEAGAPESALVDMAALVREVADDAEFEARTRSCTVELAAGEPAAVSGSTEQLRSAVENVIRNAVCYTAEGSRVEVRHSVVEADGRHQVEIRVRDRGPGVPDEDLEHVFEPFYRVADARDRSSGGTGLGLAITRRAIEIHGGTVEARNHPEGGLEIIIRLPAVRAQA
jgi:two-component system sensor histidine kinase CpxA